MNVQIRYSKASTYAQHSAGRSAVTHSEYPSPVAFPVPAGVERLRAAMDASSPGSLVEVDHAALVAAVVWYHTEILDRLDAAKGRVVSGRALWDGAGLPETVVREATALLGYEVRSQDLDVSSQN